MERLRKLAETAMKYLDSIIEIHDTTAYVDFTGKIKNKKANCRVYSDGSTIILS